MAVEAPGSWRGTVEQGRSRRLMWRGIETVAGLTLLLVVVAAVSGALVVRRAEASLTRVSVPELVEPEGRSDARAFLLVGSDSRAGLTDAEKARLTLGDFRGQRSDTMIYAAISADRSAVTLVSLPRDLLVFDESGTPLKLTETYLGGPDPLVSAIRRNLGLPVNHFAQVSLGGFIEIVRVLGDVRICLERPLVDPKSGADFTEGCHDMGPGEALSFVRSRQGERSDYERIDRQQQFLRSVLADLTDARILAEPRLAYDLVDRVASNVVTDDGLTVDRMRTITGEMLGVVRDGVPMITLPSYPRKYGGIWYVLPYGPGARALIEDLREGRVPAARGTAETRRGVTVALYSAGRAREASIVSLTLRFAGFRPAPAVDGPADLDALGTTIVYAVPENEVYAEWVAATLGTIVRPLPDGFRVPEGVQVIVAVGDDAST